jgi:hypothetical protein
MISLSLLVEVTQRGVCWDDIIEFTRRSNSKWGCVGMISLSLLVVVTQSGVCWDDIIEFTRRSNSKWGVLG